jgi:hypothetical protein
VSGRPRRFTDEQEREIAERYRAGGIAQHSLALEYDCAQSVVFKALVRQGHVPRKGPYGPYKPAGTRSKAGAGYEVLEGPGLSVKRCGTCRFRLKSTARRFECTEVEPPVALRGTCSLWEHRGY